MSRQDVDKLWRHFTSVTRARIALGRAGDALPTRRLLDFAYAHASARDAVAARVDFDAIAEQLRPTASLRVRSAAPDRSTYLRRPDLGRMLAVNAGDALPRGPFDAVFVIADGLSASAVQEHAVPLLQAVQPLLSDWTLGPVVLAEQARVALGDEIGAGMGASLVVMVIGERPGLTVPNSLGLYVTHAPSVGRRDSERNCISNIHADGLSYAAAAQTLVWLMTEARRLRLTGVALKEDVGGVQAPGVLGPGVPAPGAPKILDSAPAKLRSSEQQQGD
jgi:ethanolamine ammonia-lyase small subunit